jgi:hypothetical protein
LTNFDVLPLGLNPYENDPGAWAASLVNNAEVVLGCLDAARPKTVLEVGAYVGSLTKLLLLWAEQSGSRIIAIDPAPQPELEALQREYEQLVLIRQGSLDALAEAEELPDAIILDGDHNYYTLSRELALIEQRSGIGDGAEFPLLLLHDLGWPHGRRDDYFDPEQIPAEHRQSVVPEGKLYPGVEGTHTGGLPYHWPAAREGGPGNGVLTAVEDFLGTRHHLELMVIPTFFGLGVMFPRQAAYASDLAGLLAAWDRHPLLARLERNRVLHLASSQVQLQLATEAHDRATRMEVILRNLLASRAFALIELWGRLRERNDPPFSRSQIRRLLDS